MNSIVKLAAKITEDLIQANGKNDAKQYEIRHTKAILGVVLKKNWENKAMHGRCIRNIDGQLISEEDTFLWLTKGDLKAETESEIVEAQDQALRKKYYATKILNTETDSKCRFCHQFDETIDNIISACPILAKEKYIKNMIEWVHKQTGVQLDTKHWCEYESKSVETSRGGKVTILWNQQIQTDGTILSNTPDIVISDNEKGMCMLIDVSIPYVNRCLNPRRQECDSKRSREDFEI
jgi:hypothetical protein